MAKQKLVSPADLIKMPRHSYSRAQQKRDPLLAALIAKLPPPGADWPADHQLAWLNLMAMAFGTGYGGDAATQLGNRAQPPKQAAAKRIPQPGQAYYYIIDEGGFAKTADGKRVMPKDVAGTIFDMRGIDGDMKSIVWADDSRGLNGHDLTISAA